MTRGCTRTPMGCTESNVAAKKQPKNFYTPEVRAAATQAALARKPGVPLVEVARAHGVTGSALTYWMSLERGTPTPPSRMPKGKVGRPRKVPPPETQQQMGFLDPAEREAQAVLGRRRAQRVPPAPEQDREEDPTPVEQTSIVLEPREADLVPVVFADILKMTKVQRLRLQAAMRSVFGLETRE